MGETGLSVVVFLLDDMRADQLPYLVESRAWLAEHAVEFDRAYVTTPMCCPERASFLSGGYLPHEVGVITNSAPRGGATRFYDPGTLPTRLQEAGYATSLNGKYLNEYDALGLYVPPGYTDWAGIADTTSWLSFTALRGSTGPTASGAATEESVRAYVTEWQTEVAVDFLAGAEARQFLLLSFLAPHHPHQPHSSDVGAFDGHRYRGGAWQEADVSDKPAWIRAEPLLTDQEVAGLDANNEERLESLLAVDRAIVAVMESLEAQDRLQDTVVVITSDNGQLWGEHRLVDKGVGYEEAVRVPLLVWHPQFSPRQTEALVATNLDLAATVADLAGLAAEGRGESLRPVLCGERDAARSVVPLQAWPLDKPAWAGAVTPTWKYIETAPTEVELYDLATDPTEAENVAAAHPEVVSQLAAAVAPLRGLAITDTTLPAAKVGEDYAAALTSWGGEGTVSWALAAGELPAGLTLGADGRVQGVPTAVGVARFAALAWDSSVSPVHGGPQSDQRDIRLEVAAAEPPAGGDRTGFASQAETDCGCGAGGSALGAALLLGGIVGARSRRG